MDFIELPYDQDYRCVTSSSTVSPTTYITTGSSINRFESRDSSYPKRVENKTCLYCGSKCDDARGNCGACGAPK